MGTKENAKHCALDDKLASTWQPGVASPIVDTSALVAIASERCGHEKPPRPKEKAGSGGARGYQVSWPSSNQYARKVSSVLSAISSDSDKEISPLVVTKEPQGAPVCDLDRSCTDLGRSAFSSLVSSSTRG